MLLQRSFIQLNHAKCLFREKNRENPLALVFLHGNSLTGGYFQSQFNSTKLNHLRLVAPDLPGHGSSERTKSYSVSLMTQSIKDFCNYLEADRIILIGHSLGGHLAIQSVREISNCIGIVLSGTPPLTGAEDIGKAFNPHQAVPLLFKGKLSESEVSIVIKSMHSRPSEYDFLEAFEKSDPVYRESLGISLANGELKNELDILNDINIPTAIIQGSDDPFVNLKYLSNLAITNLWHGKVHLLPECGHSPHVECSDAFDDLLEKFVNDVNT